jgi:hypothetical protein
MIVPAVYKGGSMGQRLREALNRVPLVPQYESTDREDLERAYDVARTNYLSLHGAKTSGCCGILFSCVGVSVSLTGVVLTAGTNPIAGAATVVSGAKTVHGALSLRSIRRAIKKIRKSAADMLVQAELLRIVLPQTDWIVKKSKCF